MRNLAYIMMLALSMLYLYACEYKELEEDNIGVLSLTLVYDKVDSVPATFRVVFYPEDATTQAKIMQGYSLYDMGNDKKDFYLPAGQYHMVAWNIDTEHVFFSGYGNRNTLVAATSEIQTAEEDFIHVVDSIYEGQRICQYPDYMLHAATDVTILEGTQQSVSLGLDSMVVTIKYKMTGIKGLEACQQIMGAINNVEGKRYIDDEYRTEDKVTVLFNSQWDADNHTVYGEFYVFGLSPMDEKKHVMTFFFYTEKGGVFIPIDVTEQVNINEEDGKVIHIDFPDMGIDIRDYLSKKSIFDVEVNEWQDVNIDVGF